MNIIKKKFLNKIDLSEDDYIINDYFKPERIFKINKNFFSEKYIRSIMFNKKCVDITNKRIFCEMNKFNDKPFLTALVLHISK